MTSRIEIDVDKRLGDFSLTASFAADATGVIALFGASGAGKTSVIDMIAGLVRPDRGRIVIGDRVLFDSAAGIDRPPEARRAGYVFQDARLFPHLKVAANLEYGRRRAPREERVVSFDQVVGVLDLAHLLERRTRHLSGGERQRVAIGRALLTQPADPADGRALGFPRSGAADGDPAADRASAGFLCHSDRLCQPPVRGDRPAGRHAGADARRHGAGSRTVGGDDQPARRPRDRDPPDGGQRDPRPSPRARRAARLGQAELRRRDDGGARSRPCAGRTAQGSRPFAGRLDRAVAAGRYQRPEHLCRHDRGNPASPPAPMSMSASDSTARTERSCGRG